MATRLFLRDAAPANDPGETENSSNLPGSDAFQDYGIAVKSLSTTIGTSETSVSGSSTGNVVETAEFFTSFSSPALTTNLTAQTWTIAVDVGEGNALANSLMIPIVYTFREGTGVIGFVIDDHTAIGAEWAPLGAGRVATFSGSAVTVVAGDYLVLEFWRHTDAQAMNMSYTQTLFYDGTVDVIEDGNTSAASYLETPQDGLFDVVTRRIFNIS